MASSIPLAASGGLDYDQPKYPAHSFQAYLIVAAYGTKIAEAVAPVSFTASRTLAKTGLPRCVDPAFLGFVPPTTLVPATCQPGSRGGIAPGPFTVFDSLLCVKSRFRLGRTSTLLRACSSGAHVPCFPVNPWNITLVSAFMRRFSAVAA